MEKKRKKSKFNSLFWIYFSASLFCVATVISLILSADNPNSIIIQMIPLNVLITNFFGISMAYLGINVSEKLLSNPIYDENNENSLKHMDFSKINISRKKIVLFMWVVFMLLINLFVIRLSRNEQQLSYNVDLSNLYNYFFIVLIIFLYAEQWKYKLISNKSLLKKEGEANNEK